MEKLLKVLDERRFGQLLFQRVEIRGDKFFLIKGNWAELNGGGPDIGDKVVAGPVEPVELLGFLYPEANNDLQRARREGFEAGALFQHGNPATTAEGVAVEAAGRYPLRVLRQRRLDTGTVSAIAPVNGGAPLAFVSFVNTGPVHGRLYVTDLEALLDLAHNPTEWVVDTEPEGHRES